MGLFDWKKNPLPTPESVCPNCWGKQEYGGKAIDLMKDKQIDVNNKASQHAFIKDFVVNHVSGIQLKRHEQGHTCPSCQISFDKDMKEISR
ncbi:MAG: hypothetical protein ACJAVN_002209 [Roseivirga sp.]|jgi:hypothetical protein